MSTSCSLPPTVQLHYKQIVLDHVRLHLANEIPATGTYLNIGLPMVLPIMRLVLRRPEYAPYVL